MYKCNRSRLQALIEQFSQFGATANGGVTRLSLSKEDVLARDCFCEICKELGMDIKADDMGKCLCDAAREKRLPTNCNWIAFRFG